MLLKGASDEEFEKVLNEDYLRSGPIGIERIVFLNNIIKSFLEEIVPPSYRIVLAVCDTENLYKPSIEALKYSSRTNSDLPKTFSEIIRE